MQPVKLNKTVSDMLIKLAGKIEFGIISKGVTTYYPTYDIINDLHSVIALYTDDDGFIANNEILSKPSDALVLAKLKSGQLLTLFYTFKGNKWFNTINGIEFSINDSEVVAWKYLC